MTKPGHIQDQRNPGWLQKEKSATDMKVNNPQWAMLQFTIVKYSHTIVSSINHMTQIGAFVIVSH